MKKRIVTIVAAVLFFVSATDSCAQTAHKATMAKTEKHHRLLTAYISSLIISGGIGAITGGVARYLEKSLKVQGGPIGVFLTLLGWALESEFRNDIIIALQRDLDHHGVEYRKSLMFKSAWIASWLSYLHAQ